MFAVAALLIIMLFSLPKSVVENEADSIENKEIVANTEGNPHETGVNSDQAETFSRLNQQLLDSEDSLAMLYISLNKYDSAAQFFDLIAEKAPTRENWMKAGNTYYEAFGFAMDAEKRKTLGEKAAVYFNRILEEEPANFEVKNKLAMTYVSSTNPMQGVMMLREILQQDPQNEQALFNLGVLSMQSGQYDKAVERFSNLVELYPKNTQAHFFLGVSYLETGASDKAKEQFLRVKSLDDNPSVQATVDSYLEDM